MDQSLADQILLQVAEDYNQIAEQFALTRSYPWAEFAFLKPLLKPGMQLLDVGCGNGRLANELTNDIRYTGLDVSEQLLTIAKTRFPQHKFVTGSMLELPFKDDQFDITAAIASLQHIPSSAYRLQAMQQLARVTKPGGYLFLVNWNMQGSHFEPHRAPKDQGYDDNDFLMPWRNDQGEQLALRYYHGFTKAELSDLCQQVNLTVVEQRCTTESRNCLVIAQKT